MKRALLREHGRLEPQHPTRASTPGAITVPARAYERLRRLDLAREREQRDASTFTWFADHAKAAQWVGVIAVDGLQLELLPKIEEEDSTEARAALVTMLSYAGIVPVRARDLAQLLVRSADLGELLAALFAERLLQELVRGPERAYVVRRENLPRFRGRLVVRRHLAVNAGHRERFLCDHDELVADTALNRVFRAACVMLSETVSARRTLDLLERCLVVLDEVDDVPVTAPTIDAIALTRQTERFAPLLELCRLLFAGRAPSPQGGRTETFSLLFDMNVVFERFVAGFVAREVVPLLPGWRAHVQARGRTRHLLRSGDRGVLRLEPDLLLERPDGKHVVVDTKWKRLVPGRERPSVADLYQLYAYTQRFDAVRSVLLYPHVEGLAERRMDVVGVGDSPTGASIDVRYVRLRGIERRESRAQLAERLAAEMTG